MKTLTGLIVAAVLGWGGVASAQMTSAEMTLLQERATQEGWKFTVGENPATKRPLSALCGLLPKPSNWRSTGRFVTMKPKAAPPSSYDWRALDGCTPIRDQGYCGSCWAFGTMGVLESAILIKDKIEVDLSEQWLVSCNQSGWGCGGGLEAFDYLLETGGLTDSCGGSGAVIESDFPYEASDVPCACPYDHPFSIKAWAYIAGADDIPAVADIKQAILDYGPVTVAISANDAFQAYTGGVFGGTACSSGMLNHQVVLVGWDDSLGTQGAWIMRNSWGTGWGDAGYMYIEYNCSYIGYGACFVEYETRDALQVSPYGSLSSVGGIGGPFSPTTQQYTLTNSGTTAIDWNVQKSESWITLSSPTSGTLNPGLSVPVTVSINSGANALTAGAHDDTVAFQNLTSGVSTVRRVRLTVEPPPFYTEPLDTDPQWTAEPGWAFGVPTGQCGDPASGYTGGNVYGFNLDGCYSDDMPERTLTTAPINCQGYGGIILQFRRWLSIESNWYDRAEVRVSSDGYSWTTVWGNPVDETHDSEWVKCSYDISSLADNEPSVYIQWTMGPADYIISFGGWNIDDIQLLGSRIDDLNIYPNSALNASGYPGGPFNPSRATYSLLNTSGETLTWNATKSQDWVAVAPPSGTLSAGESITLSLAVNAKANTLPVGTYSDALTITNERTGIEQTRNVALRVSSHPGAGEYFTESFDTSGNDLSYKTLVLTPNGSQAFYDACMTTATAFPTDPSAGGTITLWDDNYTEVVLLAQKVWFYGTGYSRFYLGSNGYITFGSGDTEWWPLVEYHFSRPRISGFFDDLYPNQGGRVSYQQLSDRAVVTFDDVPEASYLGGGAVSFQIEMFYDGVIRITWLTVQPTFGIVGLSRGQGIPSDFVESDLTGLVQCGGGDESFRFLSYSRGGWYEETSPLRLEVLVADSFGEPAYQWTKDGRELSGQTSSVYEIPFLTPESQGWYTCVATDSSAKTEIETPPIFVQVFPMGSLPLAGAAVILFTAAMCAIAGVCAVTRGTKTRRYRGN